MKKLLLAILLFALLGCSTPDSEVTPTVTPAREGGELPTEGDNDLSPRPTVTPELPVDEALPTGYEITPVSPVQLETVGGYPEEFPYVWLVKPVGEQCSEEDEPKTSLSSEVSALQDAGAIVSSTGNTYLIVCEACGCPTSEHYRVRVNKEDLELAQSLGWLEE